MLTIQTVITKKIKINNKTGRNRPQLKKKKRNMSMVVYFIMKALLAVVRVFPVFSLMIAHCVFFF